MCLFPRTHFGCYIVLGGRRGVVFRLGCGRARVARFRSVSVSSISLVVFVCVELEAAPVYCLVVHFDTPQVTVWDVLPTIKFSLRRSK